MQNVLPLCLLTATTLAAPAVAQNINATLLSRLDTRGNLAGVWGYTAPDNREFAIIGERGGTWIVETTDPANPVEVAHFSASNSTWREVTMYQQYVYSVSENHAGIRIIDLSNPALPVDKGVVFASTWSNTHSISVDPDAGRLYVNGTRNGMYILDLTVTPTAPTILGTYTGDYVHDSYIRRGKGYLSEINRGNIRIVDVTNAASLTTISATQTPGAFTHNAWVSDDDELMITSDENSTGFMQAYDIRTPATPVPLGSYRITGQIVHNVFMIGRTAYLAAYSAGFHMVDLADPSTPTKLASFDTATAYTSGFNGAWGCYPFQDSGVIYVSDIQRGFHIFRVECGHLNRYGKGTPGTGGRIPRMQADGASPKVGASSLRLELANLAPSAPFVLVLGAAQASQTILGVELLVDVNGALVVSGAADGNGNANVPVPVPNLSVLGNAKIYAQIISADAGAAQGLAASRGTWFGICP